MLRSLNSRHGRLFLALSFLANVVLVIYLLQLSTSRSCLQETAEDRSNLRTVKSVDVKNEIKEERETNITYQNLEDVRL